MGFINNFKYQDSNILVCIFWPSIGQIEEKNLIRLSFQIFCDKNVKISICATISIDNLIVGLDQYIYI